MLFVKDVIEAIHLLRIACGLRRLLLLLLLRLQHVSSWSRKAGV
jgi:hypothetical protein